MFKNKKSGLEILFICKAEDYFSKLAAEYISLHFPKTLVIYSSKKDPIPDALFLWKGELIISYLSQWIIPENILSNASYAAINFHPGPPEYPGIGCTNFAIYDEAGIFGITCHHMNQRVDTGKIILVQRFPVFETDNVYSITQLCYIKILNTFIAIVNILMDGKNLPVSPEKWKRIPYIRKELNNLCKLSPKMDLHEIERRIKATTYLRPWAFFEIDDCIINLTEEDIVQKSYLKFLKLPG